jgi:ATP-dependent Lon protease
MLQESAVVAIDYVRYQNEKFGIEEDFYKKYDIHLHVLESSTPKYGVSAGIAIVTALVSALTGKLVRRGVGMTGEISLYGKVLGVRDIRDKILGAYQSGIKTVFIPKENEADLKYIPKEIKRKMKCVLVETVDSVVEQALVWGDKENNQ